MSEREQDAVEAPPIHVEPEGVKPELRKVGHRWIDLSIALSAIVLSLISLAVAIGNARTQEKMVAAATWPLLQFGTTNVSAGEPVIRLSVSNTGVGPALLRSVEMRYRGETFDKAPFLLAACCGWSRAVNEAVKAEGGGGGMITSRLHNVILAPGADLDFLELRRTEANAAVWDRLDQERFKLEFQACYCSVFEECWRSDLQSLEPEPVRSCSQPPR
jgi:hypothetical protein